MLPAAARCRCYCFTKNATFTYDNTQLRFNTNVTAWKSGIYT
jgi:hypothetical protein